MDLIEHLNTVGAEFVSEETLREAATALKKLERRAEAYKHDADALRESERAADATIEFLRARVAELEAIINRAGGAACQGASRDFIMDILAKSGLGRAALAGKQP